MESAVFVAEKICPGSVYQLECLKIVVLLMLVFNL